jgi:hypothetical protein
MPSHLETKESTHTKSAAGILIQPENKMIFTLGDAFLIDA